jgi:hypothetical protein
MDRKSKIENLNRKYLGGGIGTTAMRSESILSPGYHVDTFQRTGVVTGGVTNIGHNVSTLGGVTGGLTNIGGFGHGVSTLGGNITTIGGIGGGVTRLGPVSTNVTRVSRISPQPLHSVSPPFHSYSPPAVIRTSTVRPVLAPTSYVKPATAVLRPATRATQLTTVSPVTTFAPVTTQSYMPAQTPITYVQAPAPVSYVQAPAQVSYVQAHAPVNYVQAPQLSYVQAPQVSYVQAPSSVMHVSTVQQQPQTITTVTQEITEVTQPPPVEVVTPEPEFEPRRRPYFTP